TSFNMFHTADTSDLCVVSSTAGETIRAEPGKDAILPCDAPEKKPVIIVEWRRCDLGGNDHVALYQDDQFDDEGQNPAYKNRVDLQDREMKDGDVSLVLKNVTTDDTGTYECRVDGIKNKRRKRSHLKNEPICIINLVVSAPGETIRAEPGENAILPCEAPEKKPVIIVEWRRCDLEGNDHVALYRDEQFDNEGQNPAYKNRVDLQDREIKNGDMSLVLRNVTTDDTGTYECRVDGIKNKHRKRSHMKNEPICIITLLVSAPGESDWIRTCSCFMVTNKKPVIIVEWRRCDLEGNDHVALYRDEQFDNEGQNPAYKNRVDLQDREIKNGDMSLVLRNVTTDDTGTYECRVDGIKNKHRKRSHMKNEPICIITLLVSAPGESDWIRTSSCFMVTNFILLLFSLLLMS
uniref:Ig-like domain-containing protein n=1 Tax=Poecilia formosa TaxID=48698 RepID=A0A087XX56_POEFO